uniref:V-type proton ATPase subunit C n=1 Tax=Knipowitschia caucasica TaxID=637954 RepID=A0AAV2JDR4_KNICA
MSDFWLISVPLDKTSLTNIEKLKRSIIKTNQASCCKFLIPDLKVGILDSLVSVSDDLSGLDTLTESVLKKIGQCMKEVMEFSCDKKLEKSLANGEHMNEKSHVSPVESYFQSLQVDLVAYVTRFQWDKAKFSTSLPLSALTDIIHKEVALVETELKSRSSSYNSLKSNLQNLESKHQGSLQSRCLNNFVRKEDLVVSEYLTTLLVIVNRRLYEDAEAGIFSVTLFKRAVSQFKAKAQESKFTVREYHVELEEQQLRDLQTLRAQRKEQRGIFVCWLKVNFRQLFVSWIHLKALRVFVESVLRYGLPVNFQALLLQMDKKRSKQMREELASLFVHLDPSAMTTKTEVHTLPSAVTAKTEAHTHTSVVTTKTEVHTHPSVMTTKTEVHTLPSAVTTKTEVHTLPSAMTTTKTEVHTHPSAVTAKTEVHTLPSAVTAKTEAHTHTSAVTTKTEVHTLPSAVTAKTEAHTHTSVVTTKTEVHTHPSAMTTKTEVHTHPSAVTTKTEVSCDLPGLCLQEYFSYISVHINTTVLELR